jgi:hypothetical protein
MFSLFFRDFLAFYTKTFTVCTIKHLVQNSRIWLVSLKTIKKAKKNTAKKAEKILS